MEEGIDEVSNNNTMGILIFKRENKFEKFKEINKTKTLATIKK